MRIVIVGDGKVGSTLAAELSKEDHDVVMIDRNPEVLDELVDRTDVSAVVGNGATLQSQRDAGVGESDLLIAATSADEVNILCCMLGRKLGVKHTIARVRNPEYADLLTFLKEELRLSMIYQSRPCRRDGDSEPAPFSGRVETRDVCQGPGGDRRTPAHGGQPAVRPGICAICPRFPAAQRPWSAA